MQIARGSCAVRASSSTSKGISLTARLKPNLHGCGQHRGHKKKAEKQRADTLACLLCVATNGESRHALCALPIAFDFACTSSYPRGIGVLNRRTAVQICNRILNGVLVILLALGFSSSLPAQTNSTGGDSSFVPAEVVLTKSESLPIRLEGQTVGKANCPVGTVLKVESVADGVLTIVSGTERYQIPVASTDYLNRVAEMKEQQRLAAMGPDERRAEKAALEEAKAKAFMKKNRTSVFVGTIDKITKKGFFVNIDWIGTPGIEYKRSIGCLDEFSYPKGTVFVSDVDATDLTDGEMWKSGGEVGGQALYGIGVTNDHGKAFLHYTGDFEKYFEVMKKDMAAKKAATQATKQ